MSVSKATCPESVFKTLLYEYELTIVATIRKNKRELPPSFVNSKKRQLNSSIFGFKKDTVLVSYVPKKNKVVLLISTMHDTGEICPESGKKMLPEIIWFYNSTNSGKDIKRSVFLKTLAHELVRSHILLRASVVTLPTKLNKKFEKVLRSWWMRFE